MKPKSVLTFSLCLVFFTLTEFGYCDSPLHSDSQSNRWLIVLAGLPGDEEHEALMNKALSQIEKHGPHVFQVPTGNVRVLIGDQAMQEVWKKEEHGEGETLPLICDRENIQSMFQDISREINSDSEVFMIVMGHGNLDGRISQWNISGPDLDPNQFASLVGAIPAKRKYIWLTQSCSGYWVRALSSPEHVVIASTETGEEFTATEMAFGLGAVLEGNAEHATLKDVDEDGALSLLDLYLATCIEVHQRFATGGWLDTEHAQLDDNGDGRGSELQEPYLPVAEKDSDPKDQAKKPAAIAKPTDNSDGAKAAKVLLDKVEPAPKEPENI